MKNRKRKIIKIVKWSAIALFSYWFLTTLIFGHTELDARTGIQSFGWSGFDALFTDQEFGFFIDKEYKTVLDGVDGPYVFDDVKYSVNQQNELIKEQFNRKEMLTVLVNNSDQDQFKVNLKKNYKVEPENYEMPTKMIAISDIEGNFNAFSSFLLNNKVINKDYSWIYGDGHLVLNGDFFDRGHNVNQVLWLIYKLEAEAEEQGGKVHFINGNHEVMNLKGDFSHAQHQYIEVAKQISNKKYWNEASQFLYAKDSELGGWLRTKNIIEKIGSYIFVHGGLNNKHVEQNLSISEINSIAKEYYNKQLKQISNDTKESLVLSSYYSPYWDRSLAMSWTYKSMFFMNDPFNAPTHKTTQAELEEILAFFGAEKIVIGHSVVDHVIADYNGKVIKIDVKHGTEKNSSYTQGLLVENGIEYSVNGKGEKEKL